LDEVAPENLLSPDVLRATIAELEETLAKGKEDSEEEIKNLKESVASLEQELGQANETNEGLNKTIASFGATKAEGNNTPQVGGEVPGDVEQKP
jgi:chromosome segregation ATPase